MNFLRLLVISGFLLSALLHSTASESKAQPVQFGFTGGFTATSHLDNFWFENDDIYLNLSPKIATGYQAGIILQKQISPSLRIQTEPNIALLGGRYHETFSFRGYEFQTKSRTKLLYTQVPILFQLSTTPPQFPVYGDPFTTTTYHITGGIFGGYLLDARFEGTNTGAPLGVPFEGDFSNDVTSQYSSFDGGAILGVGLEHGSRRKIGLEVRAMLSVFESGNLIRPSGQKVWWFNPKNIAGTFTVYLLL